MDLSRWGGRGAYSFLVYGGIIFITGSGLTVRRATHVQLLFCGVILKIVFANTPDIKRVTTRLFLLACASNVSTWNCDEITQKHRRYRSTNLLYSCRAIETKTTRGKKEKKKEKKREEEKLITKKYFSKFEIEKSREIYGQERKNERLENRLRAVIALRNQQGQSKGRKKMGVQKREEKLAQG